MKKILLVVPQHIETQLQVTAELPSLKGKVLKMVPLQIATVAALTPDDIQVDLWDESLHGQIGEPTELSDYDLVGVTGYVAHLQRAREIAQLFRKRGILVAVGGSGVSVAPERYRNFFDILFIGEAELTWPQFIADWKAGSYQTEYRQVTKPDLAISPVPRWGNIADQVKNYIMGGVQTSRGCPFDCEFCDIRNLFGNRTRYKPIDKVLEEVATLERLGVNSVGFCDDNFIGNPGYAKDLLRELIQQNNSFAEPLRFHTELTINVARDEELLELLADANFNMLSIGIESTNKESLKEINKLQNLRDDLVADCKKIMSYGIPIEAFMIVGFDHDTQEIFDQHFEFLQESHMTSTKINLLKSPQGTRLHSRLIQEGRFLNVDKGLYDKKGFFSKDFRGATNIIPKGMTRAELFSGYLNLVERLYDWDNFTTRIKEFVSNVKRQPNVPQKSEPQQSLPSALTSFILSLDEKAQSAIFNIALHTRQTAPFMMRKVIRLISGQYLEAVNLPLLREAISKQIQLEESVDMKQFIEKPEILIPESFREPYQEIFPEIHHRVYTGLIDKTRTDEALIEVFIDFLTRWRKTFAQFSDQHRASLDELTDRIIAKENGTAGNKSPVQADEAVPDIKKTMLAEEIFQAVEQKLRIAESLSTKGVKERKWQA
jgi:hypothetical protein